MELTFFVAACMVLYFGSVTKPVLTTHRWFVCSWTVLVQHPPFHFFSLCHPPPKWVSWGWARNCDGTQQGPVTWNGQRDILYHKTSCSVIKMGWRSVCLPRQPLLRHWVVIGLLVGGGETLHFHSCFLPAPPSPPFPQLLNCLYPDPRGFSLLLFVFSPIPTGRGSEWAAMWVLSSWLWREPNTNFQI